eukprot:gb/GECG01006980.1/.p1 GENE.gb/GECG01006980.1/~~gb/GECG01006980.1/.p1  ORF type:complete len:140 (+),score=6.76 gb/GECG01006980.1/:1-420(+)
MRRRHYSIDHSSAETTDNRQFHDSTSTVGPKYKQRRLYKQQTQNLQVKTLRPPTALWHTQSETTQTKKNCLLLLMEKTYLGSEYWCLMEQNFDISVSYSVVPGSLVSLVDGLQADYSNELRLHPCTIKDRQSYWVNYCY